MIFSKYKYTLTVSGGTVSVNTDSIMGMIEQIIITPLTSTNSYDFSLTDRDGDILYSRNTETGTVNDRTAWTLVGRDSSERLTMKIANATINENIKIVFKIREQY